MLAAGNVFGNNSLTACRLGVASSGKSNAVATEGQPAQGPAAAAAERDALLLEPGSGGQLLQQLTATSCQHAPQLPGPAAPASSRWPFLLHPIPELPVPHNHMLRNSKRCIEAILRIATVVSQHRFLVLRT